MTKSALFRNAFLGFLLFAVVLYSLNLRVVFDLERFNPVEKGVWLLLAVLVVVRGNYNKLALGLVFFLFLLFNFLLIGVEHDQFSYIVFLMSFTQIPIFYFLCASRYSRRDLEGVLLVFCIVPVLIFFVGSVYSILGLGELFGVEYSTGVSRLKGSVSSAYLASWCIAGVYAAYKLVFMRGNLFVFFVVVNLVILFLTVARVPLFVCFVLMSYVFLFSSPSVEGRYKLVFVCGGFLVLLVLVLFFSGNYLERLSGSGGSGRDLIWEYLIYEYNTNFSAWGAGFGHQYILVPEDISRLTRTVAAHNEYIRLALELGFWGSVIFWISLVVFFSRLYVSSRSPFRGEMVVAVSLLVFFSYFDNTISSPALFSFVFCVFAFNNSWIQVRDGDVF